MKKLSGWCRWGNEEMSLIVKTSKHHRKSIRLKGYDYSQAGAYFVTICTGDQGCALGEIINGEMHLNDIGKIIKSEWMKTGKIRKNVILDSFVIMPNHLHGIVIIVEIDNGRGMARHAPTYSNQTNQSIKEFSGKFSLATQLF